MQVFCLQSCFIGCVFGEIDNESWFFLAVGWLPGTGKLTAIIVLCVRCMVVSLVSRVLAKEGWALFLLMSENVAYMS